MSEPRVIRKALVIGSTGFIGSWLVDRLVRTGVHVTGLSRRGKSLGLGAILGGPTESLQVDVAEPHSNAHFEGQDAIFFVAGSASVPFSMENPVADLMANSTNVVAALSQLHAMEDRPLFVHVSSAAVYGAGGGGVLSEDDTPRPVSPYGVSKLTAENYVTLFARQFGVPAFSVRPFSVYGPGQAKQVVFDLSAKLVQGASPLKILGDPSVSRDFVHVSDVAGALIHAAHHAPATGEVYNVASGSETTIKMLAETLLAVAGSDAKLEFSGSVRKGDALRWRADIAKLRDIGFSPSVDLSEGIAGTFSWAKAFTLGQLG